MGEEIRMTHWETEKVPADDDTVLIRLVDVDGYPIVLGWFDGYKGEWTTDDAAHIADENVAGWMPMQDAADLLDGGPEKEGR